MKKVEVVAAIIINNYEILSVQRPQNDLEYISKKFEFPGGKIEKNETKEEALKRELNEELKLDAKIGKYITTIIHQYPDFELTMHTFLVKVESRNIYLNEHISKIWLNKQNIHSVDWAEADIPVVDKLITLEWTNL